jgi:hypothetical protein
MEALESLKRTLGPGHAETKVAQQVADRLHDAMEVESELSTAAAEEGVPPSTRD